MEIKKSQLLDEKKKEIKILNFQKHFDFFLLLICSSKFWLSKPYVNFPPFSKCFLLGKII